MKVIRLDHEGKFGDIGESADVAGDEFALFHPAAEEFDMVVRMLNHFAKPFQLEFAQIVLPHEIQGAQIIIQIKRTHFKILIIKLI